MEICPHFGECGGCQSQDVPYPEQLRNKAAALEALFAPYWRAPISVTPSPVLEHYRNKVDPSFAPKQYDAPPPPGFPRETVLGFKRRGRWFWPLEIETCRIGPEGLDVLLAAVRDWQRGAGLAAYDSRTGTGFLRCLLVRDAKRTGERMVALITRPGDFDRAGFVEAVRASFHPRSIYRGVFCGAADVAAADELELLEGASCITERLEIAGCPRPFAFRISPFSFFQTNTRGAECLYARLRAWMADIRPECLCDLYGGMGGIAFACADLTTRVWSVENVPEASADGRENAAANGIGNVEFVTDKVKNWLKARLREGGLPAGTAVIADPPRAGMHPKAMRRLIELAPRHLLYVSCNPKIFAQELSVFLEYYALCDLHAVDLFPHTRHVELIAAFERRA